MREGQGVYWKMNGKNAKLEKEKTAKLEKMAYIFQLTMGKPMTSNSTQTLVG
jgi:hypothetical protein